jgi:mannitol/fructose-specific phosphotransferase system IIA component (Ntr-type)
MRVSDALVTSAIIAHSPCTTLRATVASLIDRLVEAGRLPAHLAAGAVAIVLEREAISSTAIVEIGVSIPHARLEGIDGLVAAIAVSPDAVYEVTAGLPISIVALVLSSPSLTNEHLQFLSALSLVLQSERVRNALRHAASAADVARVVRVNE